MFVGGSEPCGNDKSIVAGQAAACVSVAESLAPGANWAAYRACEKARDMECLMVVAGLADCCPFSSICAPVGASRGAGVAPPEHSTLIVTVPKCFIDGRTGRCGHGSGRRLLAVQCAEFAFPGLFPLSAVREARADLAGCPGTTGGRGLLKVVGEPVWVPLSSSQACESGRGLTDDSRVAGCT